MKVESSELTSQEVIAKSAPETLDVIYDKSKEKTIIKHEDKEY